MASAKTPTPITTSKKTASQIVAELTPQEKLALLPPAQQDMLKERAHVVEPATPLVEESTIDEPTTPLTGKKPKLSYAERLKQLPPEEAAKIRARANEQSRISKAKKRGTTPELSRVLRLKSRLSANLQKTALLETDRLAIEQELAEIEARLVAEQAEQQAVETDGENEQA